MLFENQMRLKNSEEYAWSLEAYVVKRADDIAQWHHDLEDALREGTLPLARIHKTIESFLGEALNDEDREKLNVLNTKSEMDRRCIAELSHVVVNTLVCDLVDTSREKMKRIEDMLKEKEINNSEKFFLEFDRLDLGIKKEEIIEFSTRINREEIKNMIVAAIHHSRNVERMNEKGRYIIRKLFEAYYAHPQQLPDGPIMHLLVEIDSENYPNVEAVKQGGIGEARSEFDKILKNPNIYVQCLLMRRICDHIASMTDRYAIEEYNNLYG